MSRVVQLMDQLRAHGSRPCMEGEGFQYTYEQLLAETAHWEARLAELVPAGTVAAIRADYSFPALATLLALLKLQAVVALIPQHQDPGRYLTDARAELLVEFDATNGHQLSRVGERVSHPLLERLRLAGEGGIVLFTSGSTGRPKAALQSVERFLQKFAHPGRCLRTLAFLLFDHVAGLDTLFYTLVNGGALILTRHRDPTAILRLIESHAVEVLPASPSFLRALCASKQSTRDISSLKVITYGSEPMDPATLQRITARFRNVQISQKYGTTETGSPRSVSRSNDSLWLKIKSHDVETKVVDGVLWIRSEGTILGYLNAASPLDDEGWYCTGDLVEVDGEWIRFRGRLTDVINVGGDKVAPAEVEEVLLELDFVRDAVVRGEPHELLGQVVCARVALSTEGFDCKQAVRHIRSHCRKRLALYKVPMKIEITSEHLTNSRQKRQRRHGN